MENHNNKDNIDNKNIKQSDVKLHEQAKPSVLSGIKLNNILSYLVTLIAVAVAVLSILVLIIPQYGNYQALQSEKITVESELSTIQAHAGYLQNLYSLRDKLVANIEISEQAIPVSKDRIPLVLDQLLQIAENSRVEVTDQSLSGVIESETPTSPNQIKIQMGVSGDHVNIMNFIKELEQARNLVDINSFEFSYVELDTSDSSIDKSEGDKYAIKMNLTSYYMPEINVSSLTVDDIVNKQNPEDIITKLGQMKYYDPKVIEVEVGKDDPFTDDNAGIQSQPGADNSPIPKDADAEVSSVE